MDTAAIECLAPRRRSLLARRDGWSLGVACAASMLGVLNGLALAPFLPAMARDLQTTVPILGQVATATLVLGAVLGLVIGPAVDRYGFRRPLLIGLGAVALSALGTALANDYPVLLAARLVGAASGTLLPGVALAIAGTRPAGDVRRRAMGRTVAAGTMAPIVGFPLLTAIGAASGWRAAFLALAGATAVGMALAAVVLPGDDGSGRDRLQPRALLAAYLPLLHHRPTTALLSATALRAICWSGMLTYLGAFLVQRQGLGIGQVGLSYILGGSGFLLGSLAAGGRLGRVAPRRLCAAATAAMGLLIGLLLTLPPGPVTAVAVLGSATLLGGFGWVGHTTLLAGQTLGGRATTLVLNSAIFSLGSAGGGALGGVLVALGGYGGLGLGLPGFACAAALLIWLPTWRSSATGLGRSAYETRSSGMMGRTGTPSWRRRS